MFRHKRDTPGSPPGGQPGASASGQAGDAAGRPAAGHRRPDPAAAQEIGAVYMEILQTFIAAPGPTALRAAFRGGPLTPPPVNAPGARTGYLGAAEKAGPRSSGAVGTASANARLQAVIGELSAGQDISALGPDDVAEVQGRLDGMLSVGRIDQRQHAALTKGLAVLAHLRS